MTILFCVYYLLYLLLLSNYYLKFFEFIFIPSIFLLTIMLLNNKYITFVYLSVQYDLKTSFNIYFRYVLIYIGTYVFNLWFLHFQIYFSDNTWFICFNLIIIWSIYVYSVSMWRIGIFIGIYILLIIHVKICFYYHCLLYFGFYFAGTQSQWVGVRLVITIIIYFCQFIW